MDMSMSMSVTTTNIIRHSAIPFLLRLDLNHGTEGTRGRHTLPLVSIYGEHHHEHINHEYMKKGEGTKDVRYDDV